MSVRAALLPPLAVDADVVVGFLVCRSMAIIWRRFVGLRMLRTNKAQAEILVRKTAATAATICGEAHIVDLTSVGRNHGRPTTLHRARTRLHISERAESSRGIVADGLPFMRVEPHLGCLKQAFIYIVGAAMSCRGA